VHVCICIHITPGLFHNVRIAVFLGPNMMAIAHGGEHAGDYPIDSRTVQGVYAVTGTGTF